jgi:hypothetical protein
VIEDHDRRGPPLPARAARYRQPGDQLPWGNIPLAATYVALLVGLVFAACVYGLLHSLTREARKRTRMDD